ncbi:MAG TPA: hypothetical protein VLG47_03480 [Candidatus Saccharimonadales bacterium]|nr:hypothetical protein [Candidatus Saccharimonadales bacterium]
MNNSGIKRHLTLIGSIVAFVVTTYFSALPSSNIRTDLFIIEIGYFFAGLLLANYISGFMKSHNPKSSSMNFWLMTGITVGAFILFNVVAFIYALFTQPFF